MYIIHCIMKLHMSMSTGPLSSQTET